MCVCIYECEHLRVGVDLSSDEPERELRAATMQCHHNRPQYSLIDVSTPENEQTTAANNSRVNVTNHSLIMCRVQSANASMPEYLPLSIEKVFCCGSSSLFSKGHFR